MTEAINNTKELPISTRSYFSVYFEKQTYLNVIFLLSSLATGIFMFTYAVTGISISFGMSFTVFGIFIAIIFLLSIPFIMNIYTKYVSVITGEPIIIVENPELRGNFFEKAFSLLKDRGIQVSFIFMIISLPLSIIMFTFVVTMLSISVGFIAALAYPIVYFVFASDGIDSPEINLGSFVWDLPVWSEFTLAFIFVILGIILLTVTLNLINSIVYSYVNNLNYSLNKIYK